jgi:hypothetical protein
LALLHTQGKYLMFYEGVDAAGRSSIGLAISDDGLNNWRRHPSPVLSGDSAAPDAWDRGGCGQPYAVGMAGGRYRVYYAGKGADSVGRAAPFDGVGLALTDVEAGSMLEGVPAALKRYSGVTSPAPAPAAAPEPAAGAE